jgi:hypothetical protein
VEENLYLAGLGTVLVLFALVLCRPRWAKGKRTAPVTLAVALAALAAGLPYAWRHWPRPREETPPVKIPGVAPLAAGQPVPPLAAGGWLGGPPLTPGRDGPRVIVIDVWALW